MPTPRYRNNQSTIPSRLQQFLLRICMACDINPRCRKTETWFGMFSAARKGTYDSKVQMGGGNVFYMLWDVWIYILYFVPWYIIYFTSYIYVVQLTCVNIWYHTRRCRCCWWWWWWWMHTVRLIPADKREIIHTDHTDHTDRYRYIQLDTYHTGRYR